ncbi:hypothetical protein [Peredibacter starrii]|uniref:Lysine-specific metallo-endopeptidase domain-containing protein n=1 Tax=Peredibacter starrii TaxID=28202 RepID=A0AAX4HK49_9BACT|nr:hypothetical protein [Peredibacter starrii]WPU63578.1 hypothetical protein SOO65_12850 [Peredibacter starrii]
MLFLLIQYSLATFAHVGEEHDEECLPPGLPSEEALIKSIMAPLALWTSTGVQMQKAPCKTVSAPSIEDMDDVIREHSQGETAEKTINGVILKDDPRMLKMFEHLTTNYQDPKNFQTLFNINPDCSNVTCAMTKIWGSKYAKQLSYLFLHSGFNSSEYSFPNATRFNDSEMNDLLIALKDFPSAMGPLGAGGNRQLTRYTRGKWDPEFRPGTFATSDVQVYDPWTKASSWERQQTIFHEVTHMLTEKGTLDTSAEWLSLSGWEGSDEKWTASKKNCMVGKYGSKNPYEDFAETAVAYRYNPSRLYKGCPEKYQYMKRFFKGAEYFGTSSCEDK